MFQEFKILSINKSNLLGETLQAFQRVISKNDAIIKRIYGILLLLICLQTNNIAQARFKGGVVAGFNAAQINGDASAGYHKLGLNAGVKAIIELKGRLQLSTDILWSQRGARTTENESIINRTCTLNYLEVPVLLHIRDWKKKGNDEKEYYKVSFMAGFAYGRLFKSSANTFFTHAAVLDKFAPNDVSFQTGINYFQTAHWGFSCKWSQSMTKLFNPRKYPNEPLAGGLTYLREHFITFQTFYMF